MIALGTFLTRIRNALASITSPAQPSRWVKHTIVRRIPVKGRFVRVQTIYYTFAEPSAARLSDDDVC